MRGLSPVTCLGALGLVLGCTSQLPELTRPTFAEPRSGVWNLPLPIAATEGDEMMPSVARAGWLVYARRDRNNIDIYRRRGLQGAPERLTDHPGDDTDPALSPDGKRIAFTSRSSDVKGDIWVMGVDGSGKRQVTGRTTSDAAPCWSPSGRALYLTSTPLGGRPRVVRVDLERDEETLLVEDAWDPSISPDGRILFFVALDAARKTRVFALRLEDGARAPVTDGAHPEALPRSVARDERLELMLVRFVDDENGDHRLDGHDAGSLWSVVFDPGVFEGEPPPIATPRTSGAGSELFAAPLEDWFLYTTAGYGDLEIYALPNEGLIARDARHEAILEAARSTDDPSLRRLAFRHLISSAPLLEGSARYELARDLTEAGRWEAARTELERAVSAFGDDPRADVSRLELSRLSLLIDLGGRWWAPEPGQRRRVRAELERMRVIERSPSGTDPRVRARYDVTRGEAFLALGRLEQGIELLEGIADQRAAPSEDRARALDRLADAYARLDDAPTLARICERLLRELAAERAYARRCAGRWVAAARGAARGASSEGPAPAEALPTPGLRASYDPVGVSILAELERMASAYRDLPILAARARAALAEEQSAVGHEEAARAEWRRIALEHPGEREVASRALLSLGDDAERRGQLDAALESYEQLLARYPENPEIRGRARKGISRIALRRAQAREAAGELAAAREDYRRLLENDRSLAIAHRRYIYLSARLDQLEAVIDAYRRAVQANERDVLAQYGLGYALTFGSDPDLDAAERAITRALDLDPRLAPAHLTLGWIRLQRERRRPRGGFLEKAAASFEVVEDLADRETEGELYAAARLNAGNALFALDKLDDAFIAYQDRDRHPAPFEEPLTELVFRERYARTAFREAHLQVALEQAERARALSEGLPGSPRKAAIAGLLGGIRFTLGHHREAVPWLEAASSAYRSQEDWDRAIPLLRTLGLAERRLGREDRAEVIFREIRALLAEGRGPSDPSRPVFNGVELLIWSEAPATSDDVTLGPEGFPLLIERQLAHALTARTLAERGAIEDAQRVVRERIADLRRYYEGSAEGARAMPEWIVALNEAALSFARAGDGLSARDAWLEALRYAEEARAIAPTVQIAESLLRLGLETPQTFRETDRATLLATLRPLLDLERAPLARAAEPSGAVSKRAARLSILLELHAFERALTRMRGGVPKEASPAERLRLRLSVLDQAAEAADRAEALAEQNGFSDLRAHLPPPPARRTASRGTSPYPAARGLRSSVPAEPRFSRDLIEISLERETRPWRRAYDRVLLRRTSGEGPDNDAARADAQRTMEEAIRGYLADPEPSNAPEVSRFLADAVRHVLAEEAPETAWRLLEHARLLELQPSAARRARGGHPEAWLELVAARGTGDYRIDEASTLVRALEGLPVDLAALRTALGPDAALAQVFELEGQWLWFLFDAERMEVLLRPPASDRVPSEVREWLSSRSLRTLYVDAGELLGRPAHSLQTGEGPLLDRLEVSEVLSASYLIASFEARGLAGGAPQVLRPEAEAEALRSRRELHPAPAILRLPMTPELQGALRRAGESQVILRHPEGDADLDLDRLAGLELSTGVLVIEGVPAARPARLLAHAALLAGVPAVLVAPRGSKALVEGLRGPLERRPLAEAFRAMPRTLGRDDARLFGFRGMDLTERVRFAYARLLDAARRALPAYQAAGRTGDAEDWARAHAALGELLRLIDYLLAPDRQAALTESVPGGAALVRSLPPRRLVFEEQHAATLTALGRAGEAAAARARLVDAYEASGQTEGVLRQLLELGKALASSERPDEAQPALTRCAELAARHARPLLEAECRSRLGTAHRAHQRYEDAKVEYQAALDLLVRLHHPDQLQVARYLGFLYETALNDYDAALGEFERALLAAERFEGLAGEEPSLHLDIARIHRLRGAYERAEESVERARARLPGDAFEPLTEVHLEQAKIDWYRGSYRRAREAQEQALVLSQRTGNVFRRIQALSVGGLIALNQGELEEAEALVRSALELSRKTGRRSEEAAQLNNLGVIQQRGGRLEAAIETFRNALDIDEALGSREGRAFDLRNLGTALGRRGQPEEALATLDEALELSRELGIRFNEVETLFRRGEVLERLGRRSDARGMYRQAADLAAQIAVPEVEWRALFGWGRMEEAEGERRQAKVRYARALRIAERLRRSRDERLGDATRDDLYEAALGVAVADDDPGQVFELLERRRARARLDAFAHRAVRLADPEAEGLLRAENRAQDRVVAAEREVVRGRPGAEDRLAEAKEERARRHAALAAQAPRVARSFTLDVVSLRALQARLPARTAVLAYFIGARSSFALLVTSSRAEVVRLRAERASLLPLVEEIRNHMVAFGPIGPALEAAARILIEPLADRLTVLERVVLVPDETLAALPWAALPLGTGAVLDAVSLSEASSASVLVDLLGEAAIEPGESSEVAAFAFGEDLPFAPLEARSVGTSVHIDGEATVSALRASRADAWDLAVHARLRPRDPLASTLELAPSGGSDGRLSAYDVLGFSRVPALVTLSGCETALREGPGTARLSLADAFLTAGARAVVATLHRVSDLSSALVMKWFYRYRRDRSTGEALRVAMQTVRSRHAHPAHWASFSLSGDFR